MLKIEFEGTDGAGKTTGMKYFIDQARTKYGKRVAETREVGNPNVPVCVKLRELVLSPDSGLCGEAMELIFSAMRYENDRWLKSQGEQDFVVSDRGWFSHLAYTDHNVNPAFTERLYEDLLAEETSLPDVVIYFSVSTETALKRRVSRGTTDVIEAKGVGFQELVRGSFEKYMEREENVRIYEVDANDTIEGVRFQLDEILEDIDRGGPVF
jgi:dTMP kinase